MNLQLNTRSSLNIVLAHIFLGYLISLQLPFVSRLYGFGILALGAIQIITKDNEGNLALKYSCYLMGAEVFLRMSGGAILYEMGKYGVLIFLFLGGWNGRNTNKPNVSFVFYLLLLLIGIVFTSLPEGESIRKQVAFNLSGPFLLGVCALYFYRREVELKTVYEILRLAVYPIISMSVYLYFRTPDISEIVFGGSANFKTSGGFGPNQVATAFGLGVFCLSVLLFAKKKFSGYFLFDLFLIVYLLYRGLLTFSRGGIIAAIIAIGAFVIYYSLGSKGDVKSLLKLIGIGTAFLFGVWIYTSDATGGQLNNRYAGKNASGVQKKDISSGRVNIINEQLNSFYENPILGIGVGNGKYKRLEGLKKVTGASHNEVGRLIEEHGLVGIFSLLLLFISPIAIFLEVSFLQRSFLVSFFLLWFLTINHSAMRIAFPSLIYGLSLINITNTDE